jgi:hypothetical protein
MEFIEEGWGLYFTVFYCNYMGLVQACWVLGGSFHHYEKWWNDF